MEDEVAGVGARGTERDREIERAVRRHPAGRALRQRQGAPVPPPPVPVRPAAVPPPRLRLTARGRLVGAVLALTAGAGCAALTGVVPGGAGGGLHLEGQSSVVVRPGDTLWSIATSVAGEGDVRDVVARIRQVNGLDGTVLVPGEVLRLP
jgi:nucleoid-associated protein YgaU